MNFYYFSILLVIGSNVIYHLCQKSIPSDMNPMSTLIVTYGSALLVSFVAFFLFPSKTSFLDSFKGINWASFVLGFAVVGLELGFLLAYRAGWNISSVGLLANITVALLLIPIGLLFYKEILSITNVSGIILCIIGLVLISKK